MSEMHLPFPSGEQNRDADLGLALQLLQAAERETTTPGFLRRLCALYARFSGAGRVDVLLQERSHCIHCMYVARKSPAFRFKSLPFEKQAAKGPARGPRLAAQIESLCHASTEIAWPSGGPHASLQGFWASGAACLCVATICGGIHRPREILAKGQVRSQALLPLVARNRLMGSLYLSSDRESLCTDGERPFFIVVSEMLAIAIADWQNHLALRERVKELTCLYGIARISAQPEVAFDQEMQSIVELLPSAWQYPEIAVARIVLEEKAWITGGFRESRWKQHAAVILDGVVRGAVEVHYTRRRTLADEGPFLFEERKLLETVAQQIGLIFKRRLSEGERTRLHEQIRHADRLATIGQLAAGVAHEINEPLGSILGFAELARRAPDSSASVQRDLERIVEASLQGREIIRKLLIFARQVTTRKHPISLNPLISDGLFFLAKRCEKQGIEVRLALHADLPDVYADQAQIHQVLVNLVVNAVQAMPSGGILEVGTRLEGGRVVLSVNDTGTGIPPELIERVFLPFVTTKDIDQGTGLGLALVHGIVTEHGGTVDVRSEWGVGTQFKVTFPPIGNNGK